jgi:hypothetical protein
MAYQINLTDGTLITSVPDGQIDENTTSLSLIGKNFSGFGEALNENFIKLLENFASTTPPSPSIRGQIWYDSNEAKLKVYNGVTFVPVSSATILESQPTTLSIGDLWYNNLTNQLFFFDGSVPVLIAPLYTSAQGLSGFQVRSVLDTQNQTRVITLLYTNSVLLGIFSKDRFSLKTAIDGFTGEIQPGFNVGNFSTNVRNPVTGEIENFPLRFRVTVSNSEKLADRDATLYLRSDAPNFTDFQFRVLNDLGVSIGTAGQGNIRISAGNLIMSNGAADRNLVLAVRKGIDTENAIQISSENRTINLYSGFLDSETNLGGNLIVNGNLTVNGTTTTINTQNLTIEDKAIELARQTGVTPTDENADQGGIILKGSQDKIIIWSNSPTGTTFPLGVDQSGNPRVMSLYSKAWNSSESLNLAQGRYYAIDGVPLIEQTSDVPGVKTFRLTQAITRVDGVSSFGKQTEINVGPGGLLDPPFLRFENNEISTQQSDQDLLILPNGQGNIILGTDTRIKNLRNPEAGPGGQQDAATREYVDNVFETRTLAFSIDLSDNKNNAYVISQILNNLAPPGEFRVGTIARVLCSTLNNGTLQIDLNNLKNITDLQFLTNLNGDTGLALTDVSFQPAILSGSTITVTRVIRSFQLILSGNVNVWTFTSQQILAP